MIQAAGKLHEFAGCLDAALYGVSLARTATPE
ncbi:hypothetical protein ACVWWQ_003332 [Rhodanobacter sp. TND4EL1]